jgi:S-DNA-T family DNA segregation ATPase FtsK/SpoIIIE
MMNSAQKAIVSAAKKDGLSPMEVASELMNHDITEVVLGFMRKREVAFNKLSEQEQDSVISELGSELKKITATACRVINANGVETVGATLKALKIDGKLTATMIIDGDEPNRHVLTDKAHDKSSILIVLYPNSYSEGMSAHQADKDQKSLPLDEEPAKPAKAATVKEPKAKASKKDIEIPAKQLNDARDFVTIQQNSSIAGLQNLLKCGYERANAILQVLEKEGLVVWVGTNEKGQYELVRSKPSGAAELPVFDAATLEVMYSTACRDVIKAVSTADSVLRPIYGDDDNLIEQALMRMEEDGIVSKPSPEGLRDVLTLPQA